MEDESSSVPLRVVRCLLQGDATVGKTTLSLKFSNDQFSHPNASILKKDIVVDGKPVKLLISEVAAAGQFEDLLRVGRPLHYMFGDVSVMCFSLADPSSYESISSEYYAHFTAWRFDVPIILVGTKHDLLYDRHTFHQLSEDGEAPLTHGDGMRLAETINAVCYLECSSETGEGVEEVFQAACSAPLVEKGERNDPESACSVM